MNSPLGTRVSVNQICRDCESEISGILLNMDLRVMYISEFDVILRMDWLTAHKVVIDSIVGGLPPTHWTLLSYVSKGKA